MEERDYKGYTLAQYYKNGTKQKYWVVELDGVELAHNLSTLWAAKDRVNYLIYTGNVNEHSTAQTKQSTL